MKTFIALLCMIKDEEKTLRITLKSLDGKVDYYIFLDTGSTDGTMSILEELKKEKKVHVRNTVFKNFRDSRNELLSFGEEIRKGVIKEGKDIHFYLLLDSNDELKETVKGGFRQFCDSQRNTEFDGYLCNQQWLSDGSVTSYYNSRLIKSGRDWKYKCPVHEYIIMDNMKTLKVDNPAFVIWQDRKDDNLKSAKRYQRDKEILMNEFKVNPKDPRVVFYLAQTLLCLGEVDLGMYFYKLRTTMGDFREEVFESFKRMGDISCDRMSNFPWHESMSFYMRAFEVINRVEPLVKIAKHYQTVNQHQTAFIFSKMACELAYPDDCILFVDKLVYDYERWFVLSVSAYYINQLEIGKTACLKALESGVNTQLVKSNLQFYLDKEKENEKGGGNKGTVSKKLKMKRNLNKRR